VLTDLESLGIEEAISLGDNVGYGPDPADVWRLLKSRGIKSVKGNHEEALGLPPEKIDFNPDALEAIIRTKKILPQDIIEEMLSLPRVIEFHGALCVHGCPPDSIHDYIDLLPDNEFRRIFNGLKQKVCFVGHTHRPGIYDRSSGSRGRPFSFHNPIKISGRKYIINVGSVGSSRDGSGTAQYVIWDTKKKTVFFRRVF